MERFVLKGCFSDTPTPEALRVRTGYALCEEGRWSGFAETLPEAWAALPLTDTGDALILPGLTDLHLHAPQYGYAGTAMDLQLLDWLERYTFPEESRFADTAYADAAYTRFTNDLLRSATTSACVFATIHTDATLLLMEKLEAAGLKSFVGRVSMDRNSPDSYREPSAEAGLAGVRDWLDRCESAGFRHTKPMLTPRFTPSVTDEYMRGLGELAKERRLPAQSHLNENRDEIAWVRSLCPDAAHYADTYDRFGLLDVPCVMAHCIYNTPEEAELLRRKGVYIAHCPTSNANVVAGMAPAAAQLRGGWRIGLGSDVAGGHTLNLFGVMACAIRVSKLRWLEKDPSQKPLTVSEVLYMATVGGGSFFGEDGHPRGLFEPGCPFDAIVLDDAALRTTVACEGAQRVERYIYRGSGLPVAKYVDGRRLF